MPVVLLVWVALTTNGAALSETATGHLVCAAVQSQCVISPASNFLLYSREDDTIWLKDKAGHAQLMDSAHPRLSPDGRYLAYQDEAIWGDLYVRDLETGQVTQVYTSSGTLLVASWTDDGNRLVFDHGCRIHAVDRDGSNLETLIEDWPEYYDCYNDSPNGAYLVAAAQVNGVEGLYAASTDGSYWSSCATGQSRTGWAASATSACTRLFCRWCSSAEMGITMKWRF